MNAEAQALCGTETDDLGLKARQARFNRLVTDYSAALYRYAYWLCGHRSMADDLVQETWLRAWRALDNLNEDAAGKAWLITILRREHARQYDRPRPVHSDLPPESVRSSRPGFDTSTEAFNLRRAIAALPPEYREPLVLQVIGGYDLKEIGDLTGISAAGVATRVFRARQRLRSVLGESSRRPDRP